MGTAQGQGPRACEPILTANSRMQQVLRQVTQVAATDACVCLVGESGTGKELLARAIHVASPRAHGPFVAVNCGAIPDGLLENELFGHVKGAYTGADRDHQGVLRAAAGGTVLLDEITELPRPMQVKLLRVLQEQECAPLGAGRPVKLDCRVITATNQDLWQAVEAGTFRADLYYRIHVIPLVLPPLRERPEDIPLLAEAFVQQYSVTLHKSIQGFAPPAMQRLLGYPWPGNIRELRNVIERAVVLATEGMITPDVLCLGVPTLTLSPRAGVSLKTARLLSERAYLVQELTAAQGNVTRTAARAGVSRGELYTLLHKHGLDPAMFRVDDVLGPHGQVAPCAPALPGAGSARGPDPAHAGTAVVRALPGARRTARPGGV